MHYFFSLLLITLVLPAHVFAAPAPTDLKSFLGILSGIINLLIPLIFALTFLTIMWGVVKAWIMGDSTDEDIAKGKNIAIAGVIGLALMSAIWGILRFLQMSIFE